MAALLTLAGQSQSSVLFHCGDGYFYHLNNKRQKCKFAYLRCIHYGSKKMQCYGTAKALLNQGMIYHMHQHSHQPNVYYPLVRSLKKDIIDRVKGGDSRPFQDIIQEEGQKYPLAVRAQVGLGSIVSWLSTVRSKLMPNVPRSLGVLGALLLLPEYAHLTKCHTVPESLFAGMCGNMGDKTLSLVFISPEMKEFMQTRNMVFADGTERKLFRKPKASQIYVISAAYRFHAIVMTRAIMLRRTENAYNVLLDFLIELLPNFSPKSVKCDFEDAQLNAWRSRFPHASVEGCLWHYDVAVYSHPKNKLGLYPLIMNEEEVSSIVRAAGALPLLPTDEIYGGLLDLGHEALERGWMAELKPFFKYMEREWVPKIPVLSVAGSVHRTNNISESTNRTLNKEIKVSNPSCFNVLKAFVSTNEKYTVDYHILQGQYSKPGRNRKISALKNDATIRRLEMDLQNGDISRLQFLHKASRRMQNVFNKVFK